MNIIIKCREDLPEPQPWYAHEALQGLVLEVQYRSYHAMSGTDYYRLTDNVINYVALHGVLGYLTNRMQIKIGKTQLDTVYIRKDCCVIHLEGSNNLEFASQLLSKGEWEV